MLPEHHRLIESREGTQRWKFWGPYLSERQWGTVREDYSDNGDAWNYLPHDHARSRAYRWGEDGLGGICDAHQVLCFALTLWNEQDPILKERLFGLTNSEGNHGEDVKEYYFYLDSTPTHSYMKYLYKYPQHAFPYDDIVQTNARRSRHELEYELIDTGIFDEDRYFDVFVEYAKAAPEDILIKITVHNRGPEAAPIHLLPTLWYRNTWSWGQGEGKPILKAFTHQGQPLIYAHHNDPLFSESLPDYYLYCDQSVPLLFTENETNQARLFNTPNPRPYVKDSFHTYLIEGQAEAVNPEQVGTKVAPHYHWVVPPGESRSLQLRLTITPPEQVSNPWQHFEDVFTTRIQEADGFYEATLPATLREDTDRYTIARQALAGML
ncbi:MAG: glucosidase, partial [Gloeomargaritaceae cyanobacterium C42_A2020_066]|nr:glucosidase [Gloeomargaritaceae cyanobacterium C42_A2020_066]